MSQPPAERLYNLLPTVYRQRDLESGQPLRALMTVLERELHVLERDIDGLYDDAFIETCQPWVVPYIAELLGIRALGSQSFAGADPRAQVANVLALRQLKGTPLALERATHDVTGLAARVVELFRFQAHTQNIALVRPGQGGTFDVRRGVDAAADVLEAPFSGPEAFRTVDVRRIAETGGTSDEGGLYNLPHLAFFLWRLKPYRLADGPTSSVDDPPARRYRLDPLGRDLELFHPPQPDPVLVRQSGANDLPVAITRRLLDQDLQAYRRDQAAVDPGVRPTNSDFYGPDRGLWIENGGMGVPAFEVASRNLDAWGVPGVLSEPLPASISLGTPEIEVDLGGTSETVTLARAAADFPRLPRTVEEGREVLEARLQAGATATFTDARVRLFDGRLLILPGDPNHAVTVTATAGDPLTAGRLGLDQGLAINGWLSDVFATFPTFNEKNPALDITLGSDGPFRATLDARPSNLRDLRARLERAIRAANSTDPNFGAARVLIDGSRLLLLSGDLIQPMTVGAVNDFAAWAPLTFGGSTRGLLSPDLTVFPALRAVRISLGDLGPVSATFAGVPNTPTTAAILLEGAIRRAGTEPDFRRARVHLLSDLRLLVLSGEPGDEVTFQAADGPGGQLETDTLAALGLTALVAAPGALSGVLDPFPHLRRPAVQVTLGGRVPRTATLANIPGKLDTILDPANPTKFEEARLLLEDALRQAQDSATFAGVRVRVPTDAMNVPVDERLLVLPGSPGDPVAFAAAPDDALTVEDLKLRQADGARQLLGLLSGSLNPFPGIAAASPELQITLGTTTNTVTLSSAPADLFDAADQVQSAIQSVLDGGSFQNARVLVIDDQLLVLSGTDREEVRISGTNTDPETAVALKLTRLNAVETQAFWSGDLSSVVTLRAAPRLSVELSPAAPVDVRLTRLPRDLRHAVELLQVAIAGLDPNARVLAHEGHLLILAGDATQPVTVRPAAGDDLTARRLDLSWSVAVDPQLGRVLFGPDPTVGAVRAHHTYGFSADLGGGPYDRRRTLAVDADFQTVLEVAQSGVGGAFTRLTDALADWESQGKPDTIIRILDSELYVEEVRLELAADRRLVIEAADGQRPILAWPDASPPEENLRITGASGAALTVNGLLLDGTIDLENGFDLRFLHTTLLPRPDSSSLRHTGAAGELEVRFESSITGALALPGDLGCLELADSILDAEGPGLDATPWPALISDRLPSSLNLGALLEVEVTLGGDTAIATLSTVPANLTELRRLLERAIRDVGNPQGMTPSFADATVLQVGDRLLVRSGNIGESVSFAATTRDRGTIELLGLIAPPAESLDGLLSGDLSGFQPFTLPQLDVTLGPLAPLVVTLATEPSNLNEVATALQAALRAVSGEDTFTNVRLQVLTTGNSNGQQRLLLRPGVPGDSVQVAATASDPDSLTNFRLDTGNRVDVALGSVLGAITSVDFPSPELQVSVGSSALNTIDLLASPPLQPLPPTSVAEAAARLNVALDGTLGFDGSNVLELGNRLLVRSPAPNEDVRFVPTTDDPTTAGELGLEIAPAGTARSVRGLLSGTISFNAADYLQPVLNIQLGMTTSPGDVVLDDLPENLSDAARLIEAAVADGMFTAEALGFRLLLRRGGDAVAVANSSADSTTAGDLGLTSSGRDLTTSLLSGEISPFPEFVLPQMEVTLGDQGPHPVIFSRYPQDRNEIRILLQAALRAASGHTVFRLARVGLSDDALVILPGSGVGTTALFAGTEEDPTTISELALQQPPAVLATGLLSGRIAPFPDIGRREMLATLGSSATVIEITGSPTSAAEAAPLVQSALNAVAVTPEFTGAEVKDMDDRLLVLIGGGSGTVSFATTGDDGDTANALGLTGTAGAAALSCRLSGDLSAFTGFQIPEVEVTYNSGGTSTATTAVLDATLPTTLNAAAAQLAVAINANTLGNTNVTTRGTRLLVAPGADTNEQIEFALTTDDVATAQDLRLRVADGAQVGLLGTDITGFTVTAAVEVEVTIGVDSATASLVDPITDGDLQSAADALQNAIRTAVAPGSDDRFNAATVVVRDNGLFVVPGGSGGRVSISTTGTDGDTATDLGLSGGTWGLLSGDLGSTALQLTLTPELGYNVGAASGTITFATVPINLSQVFSVLSADPGLSAAALIEEVAGGTQLRACPRSVTTVNFTDVGSAPAPQMATALQLTAAASSSVSGLLGDDLSAFMGLSVDLQVTLGGDSRTVALNSPLTNLEELATSLQNGIRAAAMGNSESFDQASVLHLDDQVFIIPGTPGDSVVVSSASGTPGLAEDLQFTAATGALPASSFKSGAINTNLQLSVVPDLQITFSDGAAAEETEIIRLPNVPRSPRDLRALLELGIRTSPTMPSASFSNASVERVGGRLRIISGDSGRPHVRVEDTGNGPVTAILLGLDANASSDAAGQLSDTLAMPRLTHGSPEVEVNGSDQLLPLASNRTLSEVAATLAGVATLATATVVDDSQLLLVSTDNSAPEVAMTDSDPAVGDPTSAGELRLEPSDSTAYEVRRTGLLSADLSTFPATALTGSLEPQMRVRLGSVERVVRLGAVPETLAQAADLLQAALNADPWPSFNSARVLTLNIGGQDHLLILPGPVVTWIPPGQPPRFLDFGLSNFASFLGLTTASGAVERGALLSGALSGFPTLSIQPRLDIEIGGLSARAVLRARPATLVEAGLLLQEAIRDATLLDGGSLSQAFTESEVLVPGSERILVLPGGTGNPMISVTSSPYGTDVADLLKLRTADSAELVNGLLSEDLSGFAGLLGIIPAVRAVIGDEGPERVALNSFPTDLADAAAALQVGLQSVSSSEGFASATVQVIDERLLITPGGGQSIALFDDPANPKARSELGLDLLTPVDGLMSGTFETGNTYAQRPDPQVNLDIGSGPQTLILAGRPATLAETRRLLQEAINATFAGEGMTVQVLEQHLLVRASGLAGSDFVFGAVSGIDTSTVARLRLDAVNGAEEAEGLLSSGLGIFPNFGARPAVRVTLGEDGPHDAVLDLIPKTAEEARNLLEVALQRAHNSTAFLNAQVFLVDDPLSVSVQRLVIVPGESVPVEVLAHPATPETAAGLGLVGGGVRRVQGLLSGALPGQLNLATSPPALGVVMSLGAIEDGPFDVELTGLTPPDTLDELALALQGAVRSVTTSTSSEHQQAFNEALGLVLSGERLLLLPGADGTTAGLTVATTDATTLAELRFGLSRAVGVGTTEQTFGPPMKLERTTVLGRLQLREIPLASEVLFTKPVRVERQQVGCIRFSYLPPGSTTPRCFRCQPDLALETALREALEEVARQSGLSSIDDLPAVVRAATAARQRNLVLARLAPRFTSNHYGDPGYAQLVLTTAAELASGAENGSELGAFHLLQQPERRGLLRVLLEEYLRFGLEAGIFPVT